MTKSLILICVLLSTNLCFAKKIFTQNEHNFSLKLTIFDTYQLVQLSGKIIFGDFTRAEPTLSKLEQNKDTVLDLSNFRGGYDNAILSIAKSVSKKCSGNSNCHIKTYIKRFSECSSFCLLLYMIGDSRLADEDAVFGFHASFFGPIKSTNGMISKYRKAGVNKDWLQKNRHYFLSKEKITYKNPNEVIGSNIVTHILDYSLDLNNL